VGAHDEGEPKGDEPLEHGGIRLHRALFLQFLQR
jgi:hypothetical protein